MICWIEMLLFLVHPCFMTHCLINNNNNNNSNIIIKCWSRSGTLTTTNTNNVTIPVTLYNNQKRLTNMIKSSTSDTMWVLYASLKLLFHHLTWWIRVHYAAWIPCLELFPTWFLKDTCSNDNINKHSCNNKSINVITKLK